MFGKGLALISTLLLAAGMAFGTNWLALMPWRRVKHLHWTESARLLFPIRVAAAANLWVIPTVLTFVQVLLWPESSPHWAGVALAAALGSILGTIPMDHEIFPRTTLPELWRQSAIGCLMRFLIWFVFVGAMATMPAEFNLQALLIFVSVILLQLLWARWGLVWLGLKLRLFQPAPERLQRIVTQTAARMEVPFSRVFLMRGSISQAFALIGSRELLFTGRLLQMCSDEEVAAICAHELAHLTESKAARVQRSIGLLTLMPWLLFKPVIFTFGVPGFLVLLLLTVSAPKVSKKISRKLESRADLIAKSNEGESGAYTRALSLIHEDALIPAVLANKNQSHPDLYDRLLAAGVTPDYPKPAPAASISLHGTILMVLMGVLLSIFVLRMLH